jgi:hypothetical protein
LLSSTSNWRSMCSSQPACAVPTILSRASRRRRQTGNGGPLTRGDPRQRSVPKGGQVWGYCRSHPLASLLLTASSDQMSDGKRRPVLGRRAPRGVAAGLTPPGPVGRGVRWKTSQPAVRTDPPPSHSSLAGVARRRTRACLLVAFRPCPSRQPVVEVSAPDLRPRVVHPNARLVSSSGPCR